MNFTLTPIGILKRYLNKKVTGSDFSFGKKNIDEFLCNYELTSGLASSHCANNKLTPTFILTSS